MRRPSQECLRFPTSRRQWLTKCERQWQDRAWKYTSSIIMAQPSGSSLPAQLWGAFHAMAARIASHAKQVSIKCLSGRNYACTSAIVPCDYPPCFMYTVGAPAVPVPSTRKMQHEERCVQVGMCHLLKKIRWEDQASGARQADGAQESRKKQRPGKPLGCPLLHCSWGRASPGSPLPS